jgi:hypothetical protein
MFDYNFDCIYIFEMQDVSIGLIISDG